MTVTCHTANLKCCGATEAAWLPMSLPVLSVVTGIAFVYEVVGTQLKLSVFDRQFCNMNANAHGFVV